MYKKHKIMLRIVCLLLLASLCQCRAYGQYFLENEEKQKEENTGSLNNNGPAWARSTIIAPNNSDFKSVAVDSSGNVYAAGYIYGNGTYDFGNSVTVSGNFATGGNAALVKYDSNGSALWAKWPATAPNQSEFKAVAVDSSGNVYAAGYIYGNSTFGFGNSVTVIGADVAYNAVLVKYDSNGSALWAKSTLTAPAKSEFKAVAVDSSGNVYAAGYIFGNGTFDFGSGNVSGGYGSGLNAVLVKYDSNGNALWAKPTVPAPNQSEFKALAVDSSGNVYAAGDIFGSSNYDFGNFVTVNGANGSGLNAVLVKYNSTGTTVWAQSTSTALSINQFKAVAVDSSGNVYAGGYISGTTTFDFGSVSVTGNYGGPNAVLVKYDGSGTAQWARSTVTAPQHSEFFSLGADSSGNVYAGGVISGNDNFDFGNSVTVSGNHASLYNAVLVKYNSLGVAEMAKSTATASGGSEFKSIVIDSSGYIYAAGYISGNGSFTFEDSGSVAGGYSGGTNALLVQYK